MKMCHNKVKKKTLECSTFFIDMPLKGVLHCLHVIEGNFYIVKSAKICKLYLKTHSLICFIYQYLIPRLLKKSLFIYDNLMQNFIVSVPYTYYIPG